MKPPNITPGDWLVYDADGSVGAIEAADGTPVASAQIVGGLGRQNADTIAIRKANAQFLAASKKMAQRLEAVIAAFDYGEEHFDDSEWRTLMRAEAYEAKQALLAAGYSD